MEFGAVFWVSVVLHSLICAGFCSHLAREKGYDSLLFGENPDAVEIPNPDALEISAWLLLGFIFGIFALIAAAGLPDRKKG